MFYRNYKRFNTCWCSVWCRNCSLSDTSYLLRSPLYRLLASGRGHSDCSAGSWKKLKGMDRKV